MPRQRQEVAWWLIKWKLSWHHNQYISQQIFNILTAQAVTTDYDENYFRRAGIDIGETIRLDEMLYEFENPAKILDTNWYAIKPMYEKKYRELIHNKDKFVSINDIRLSRDSVKKAIKYLREIYRHKISKTKVISLNSTATTKHSSKTPPQTE